MGESTVLGIIKNEKYIGDLVQGKTITVDPITHRRIDNRGEADMFYLEDAHPAIIDRDTWDKAQAILKRRNEWRVKPTAKNGNKYSRKHAFSCMIKCGFCGHNLSRRSHHSGTTHQKWVWHCVSYTKKGKQYCPECKAVDEAIIEGAFVQGYNLLAGDNSDVLSEFLNRLENSLFTAGSAKRLEKITKQIKSYEARRQKLLDLLLDGTISKSDYAEKKAEIDKDLQPLYEEQKALQQTDDDEQRLKQQLTECKEALEANPILQEFDRRVFEAVIDHVVIGERHEDGTVDPRKITFVFKAGIQPPPSPPISGNKTCSLTRDNTC
ncbi:site-specific recombinase [Acetivibrio straminisolvens JCM 21531]|uniref:Site-specific recombinase n=2 Tax=Acetivibrio straminisolvens TaxID=253314 RepID=W4V9E9_9FIRM|nr:site-specific recombinase [Acetivibrio straminisolvens JCM 21531]